MNGKHCVFVAASDLVGTQQPKNPYQSKMFCLFTFSRNKCSHSSPKAGDICAHSENTILKVHLCPYRETDPDADSSSGSNTGVDTVLYLLQLL